MHWITQLLPMFNPQLSTTFNRSIRFRGSQPDFSCLLLVTPVVRFDSNCLAFVLPFGQFAMIFPAKWYYIAMVILFEVGSAICGAAPNINALIVGRVIAGIGAVGIYTGALFLISVNTSEEERYTPIDDQADKRPKYIGMTGAMWGLGTVLGPVVGGAFTDGHGGWRWAFYVNLPIGALTAPFLLFLIPPFDALKGTSFIGRLKLIDWIGLVLFCGSICSLVLGLQFGGNLYSWNSRQVIGCFVSFGVTLVLFAFSQTLWMPWQTNERRIFPVEMLIARTPLLLFILTATGTTAVFLAIYYIPLYFQFTRVVPNSISILMSRETVRYIQLSDFYQSCSLWYLVVLAGVSLSLNSASTRPSTSSGPHSA